MANPKEFNQTINKEIGGEWEKTGVGEKASSQNGAPNASYHAEFASNNVAVRASTGAGANAFEYKDKMTSIKAFGAECGADAEAGLGGIGATVKAKAHLVEAEGAGFGVNLGLGVSTGGQIGPGGVEVKVAGTGISLGKKTGISVFDNEFYIDFGKMADAFDWF